MRKTSMQLTILHMIKQFLQRSMLENDNYWNVTFKGLTPLLQH